MVVTQKVIDSTQKRLQKFEKLKSSGAEQSSTLFWDFVILTAIDERQKSAFQAQIKAKLAANQLPSSAEYLVICDPPGYKIGNGGSTLVVLEFLFDNYGMEIKSKKVIVIHAGGFSQRLPNASAVGKVFTAVPSHEPIFQMLDVKLASYIDFPSKICGGGVFVCCSDTLEVYHDSNVTWKFPQTGITGLAHPSSLEIGATHGVYLLDKTSVEGQESLVYKARKFLHKPPIKKMRETDGLITEMTGEEENYEMVFTDSAYFMSGDVCYKLMMFYKEQKPLTCEIDAYGDILQSLGTEADDSYINNTANVVSNTNSLLRIRKLVYNCMEGTSLHAVVLAPIFKITEGACDVTSHFYHFGTVKEYLQLLTEDKPLAEIFGAEPTNFCKGHPLFFRPLSSLEKKGLPKSTLSEVGGIMSNAVDTVKINATPCIMASCIYPGVSVGEGSVLEYCLLLHCVSIGTHCVISGCSLKEYSKIPSNTFMHTISVTRPELGDSLSIGYATVAFGILDDLKASSTKLEAGQRLKYFGRPLNEVFKNWEEAFSNVQDNDIVTLWKAKLFQVHDTMAESSWKTCEILLNLEKYDQDMKHLPLLLNEPVFSMADVLEMKNVDDMLRFRSYLESEINASKFDLLI